MRFWDTSAIIPLIIEQDYSEEIKNILKEDSNIIVWWGSIIECHSALSRLVREKSLDFDSINYAVKLLNILQQNWTEILPCTILRDQAIRIISVHGLKTLDSLQLASALIWTNKTPANNYFVSLDQQLRVAAAKEGYQILPERLNL